MYVWRGIIALSESIIREKEVSDPQELIENLLAYRLSSKYRTVKVAIGTPDSPIQALTAHASKGLEFDYVFIPHATEEAWVGKPRGASFILPKKQTDASDIRDTRRLFYVALTRARKHATVLTALEESDGKSLSPLRFLSELDQAHVKNIRLPRMRPEALYKKSDARMKQNAFADAAKEMLLKKGISVTALNHFLECPNKFLYLSILLMPEASSPSSEKGKAIHEAIGKVWKLRPKKKKEIEETMKKAVEAYFKESLMPRFEKSAIKKELESEIPKIAAALESHFVEKAPVLSETRLETQFNGSYRGKPVTMPLHGKLDAILDTKDEVLIFDYKSKQSMSEAAIKGETKSSDGNYFRQLVFYKILAKKDSRFRGRNITPSLVFVSPDKKGRCPIVSLPITEKDEEKVRKEIQEVIESVWSGKISAATCGENGCEWCGLREIGMVI
jgi:DNA helicase-2/ATP-dependent DNA helicase PcrA